MTPCREKMIQALVLLAMQKNLLTNFAKCIVPHTHYTIWSNYSTAPCLKTEGNMCPTRTCLLTKAEYPSWQWKLCL